MRSERGRAWLAGLVLVAALVGLGLLVRWFLRSDEQRISERVDVARDALVAQDQEAFLAVFGDDVVYQSGGDRATLAKDLRRWCEMGITQVHIVERTIEVDSAAGTGTVWLRVLVGHKLLQMGEVQVDIDVVKDATGDWRVRAFTWKRP